jgi:hypothetical protein
MQYLNTKTLSKVHYEDGPVQEYLRRLSEAWLIRVSDLLAHFPT